MRNLLCLLLIATLGLSACSGWRDSGANPRNWFGGGGSTPSAQPTGVPTNPSDRQTGNPLIEDEEAQLLVQGNTTTVRRSGLFRRNKQVRYEGTLVDQVSLLAVERLPTGAIVRVEGQPLREGAFDVRLLQVNPDGPVNGVMEFTLNALQPVDFGRGTESTRQIDAAAFLSNAELEEIVEIRVRAARNSRSVRP
ncbi:MAG: hypothetical protein AAF484_08595 [Pseudomonadota bacterium]